MRRACLLLILLTGCLGEGTESLSGATSLRGDLRGVWRMQTLTSRVTLELDECEFKMTYDDGSSAWGIFEVDARGPTQGILRLTVLKEGSSRIRATEHFWEFTLDPLDLLTLTPRADNVLDRRRFGNVSVRFVRRDDVLRLGSFLENGGGPQSCRTAAGDQDAVVEKADCEPDSAHEWDTDLATSTSHCGACGAACSWPDGTLGVCTEGACNAYSCPETRHGAQTVDCDGHGFNGCEAVDWSNHQDCDTAFGLGSVYGDTSGARTETMTGWGEATFRFRIVEGSSDWFSGTPLRARVTLEAPIPDYELDVIEGDCRSGTVRQGQFLAPGTLVVAIDRPDETSGDDGTTVAVRIRDTGGTAACETWSLVVEGNN